jgi:peptide/nickel transport system substrate-binding protein
MILGAGATTALGAAAAAAVGCGGGSGENGTPTPSGNGSPLPTISPTPGGNGSAGSVTWGRAVEVLGVDPHGDLTGLDVDMLVYSYLYSWIPGPELAIFDNLAASLEMPDDEHLEFIFDIRPGFKIQLGGPGGGDEITSADCESSFKRRSTAVTAIDKRFPNKIDHYETPDPRTFKFVMKQPFAPSVREMANPTWAIVPQKVSEEFISLSQTAFGSGPFILDDLRGSERVVLTKNPEYILAPRPWLDEVTRIIITENSSLVAAFRSGAHDINGAVLTRAQAEDFDDDPDFTVDKSTSLFYPVIHFKMKPPFDDIRVRHAIDLGLDRDDFIQTIQDGEGNYNGPIQWPQFQWALPQDELREFYRYDPEGARTLLAEAGFADGFTMKMKLPKIPGVAQIGDTAVLIKEHLGRVGVNVEIDEVELGAFIGSTILPGNFDTVFFPNLPYDEPDRPLSFYHSKGVTSSGNWNNYSNREIDALIDAQALEFDFEKRKAIVLEAQRMILDEHGPQITLTGGFEYAARWSYIQFPDYDEDTEAGPFGVDIFDDRTGEKPSL